MKSAVVYIGLITTFSLAAYKKKQWLNSNLENYNEMCDLNKMRFVGEIIELSKIAPETINDEKHMQILKQSLNQEIEPIFKCRVIETINKINEISKNNDFMSKDELKKLGQKIFEKVDLKLKNGQIDNLVSNRDYINLIYKIAQLLKNDSNLKESNSGINDSRIENKTIDFNTLINLVPKTNYNLRRFFNKDYFINFTQNSLLTDLNERAKLSLIYGTLYSTTRNLLFNFRPLRQSLLSTFSKSLIFGFTAATASLLFYSLDSLLDELVFDSNSLQISSKLVQFGISPFLATGLANFPTFAKISIFLFISNRFISPFSNIPFFITFVLLSPFKERLKMAV